MRMPLEDSVLSLHDEGRQWALVRDDEDCSFGTRNHDAPSKELERERSEMHYSSARDGRRRDLMCTTQLAHDQEFGFTFDKHRFDRLRPKVDTETLNFLTAPGGDTLLTGVISRASSSPFDERAVHHETHSLSESSSIMALGMNDLMLGCGFIGLIYSYLSPIYITLCSLPVVLQTFCYVVHAICTLNKLESNSKSVQESQVLEKKRKHETRFYAQS
ncbi:hypothetical protein K435DRAFT_832696 [Dendrothele bispora CBS 962.96]|uniref:Uncharacterized protein n=1 Tax=Dendrothele bispora (strain CBS 962.96) TaxID=1314807 RepID=A0A4S8MZW8_DENBC|nr:hypothetical protein K435DRAFT_832696 [Dendrothele bispora CBS 962.96]